MSFYIQKAMSMTHKFQKRSTKIFTTCRIKLDVKKYVSVNAFTTLMPANLSILIIKKFINANNKVFLKTWFFPFFDHFLDALGIIAFNIKRFSVCFFVSMFICMKKKSKWYMHIPSWDTFHQTIQRPDWLGLLKTDHIITQQ